MSTNDNDETNEDFEAAFDAVPEALDAERRRVERALQVQLLTEMLSKEGGYFLRRAESLFGLGLMSPTAKWKNLIKIAYPGDDEVDSWGVPDVVKYLLNVGCNNVAKDARDTADVNEQIKALMGSTEGATEADLRQIRLAAWRERERARDVKVLTSRIIGGMDRGLSAEEIRTAVDDAIAKHDRERSKDAAAKRRDEQFRTALMGRKPVKKLKPDEEWPDLQREMESWGVGITPRILEILSISGNNWGEHQGSKWVQKERAKVLDKLEGLPPAVLELMATRMPLILSMRHNGLRAMATEVLKSKATTE